MLPIWHIMDETAVIRIVAALRNAQAKLPNPAYKPAASFTNTLNGNFNLQAANTNVTFGYVQPKSEIEYAEERLAQLRADADLYGELGTLADKLDEVIASRGVLVATPRQ